MLFPFQELLKGNRVFAERFVVNEYGYTAEAVHMQEEVMFTSNWQNDVTTAHVIRYNGVLWNITRVDTFGGYKGIILLYCKVSGHS